MSWDQIIQLSKSGVFKPSEGLKEFDYSGSEAEPPLLEQDMVMRNGRCQTETGLFCLSKNWRFGVFLCKVMMIAG